MATSQTTNLQLTKYGAGTDNLLRSDFNGNMDKIDAFAGSANTAIAGLKDIAWTYRDNGTDFNNVTTPGAYYFYTNQHQPTGSGTSASWGVLVFANPQGTIVKQIAYEMGNGNDVVYQRRLASGSWTAWDSLKQAVESLSAPTKMNVTSMRTGDSIHSGGYWEIGKLVIINIRLNIGNATSGATSIVTGLPAYTAVNSYTLVTLTNNRGAIVNLLPSGDIQAVDNLATGSMLISGCYIKT